MKGYFQTWSYVAKIRRIPLIGRLLSKILQSVCGVFGHELSKTEWGYGGGDTCDRWCRWCNKLIIVPKTSIQFAFKEHAHLMKEIE
jgi:hypothetical protein